MTRNALLAIVAGAAVAPGALAQTQWDFNNGAQPTLESFGPSRMTLWQATPAPAIGTASSFGLPLIGGVDAVVAEIPKYTPAQALQVDTRLPGNGGGVYINEYTIVYDILFPPENFTTDPWFSFFNTNCCNTNDGDLFLLGFPQLPNFPTPGLGISGVYEGTFQPNTWYRIVSVFDLDSGAALLKFVDGTLIGAQTLSSGLDGRWALYSTTDGEIEDWFFLFADNSGETSRAFVNSVAFIDRALTETEVAALGAADADGPFSAPPPSCRPDLNNDGELTFDDIQLFVSLYNSSNARADLNNDGEWTFDDIQLFIQLYNAGC